MFKQKILRDLNKQTDKHTDTSNTHEHHEHIHNTVYYMANKHNIIIDEHINKSTHKLGVSQSEVVVLTKGRVSFGSEAREAPQVICGFDRASALGNEGRGPARFDAGCGGRPSLKLGSQPSGSLAF